MSFAFIGTGHICTGRHACTQIHIYQPFSLCVLLFPGGWKSNFLPKDGTRGPSPPGQTALYVQCRCSVLADTDVIWCWAADGETVDVWRKVSFKLERARKLKNQRKSSLCLQEERGMNPDSERYNSFNWRCQRKVRYLWILSDGNIAYGKNKAHIPVSPSRQCVSLQNICIAVLSRPDSPKALPLPLFSSLPPFFFSPPTAYSLSRTASGAALVAGNAACAGVWGDLSLHGEQETLSSGKSVNEALTICWRCSASCGWISWDFSS